MNKTLHIIGAGMAGSEAAWQAANQDVDVVMYEMRPKIKTFAHNGYWLDIGQHQDYEKAQDDVKNLKL